MPQNSRYETGEREADYKTLILLADYFDVSIDYLLERTDDPTFHKESKPPVEPAVCSAPIRGYCWLDP